MTTTTTLEALRQEAAANLSKRAAVLRKRLESGDTKVMDWSTPPQPACPTDSVLRVKVRRGYIILREPTEGGVPYTSSFGGDSEYSFSGFLPGVTMEEAKLLVYGEVAQHNRWVI